MFVFISELCLQQAKRHQIDNKIYELKRWVEQGDFRHFAHLFEVFSHPYYVRKKIALYYRLIAKYLSVNIEGKEHGVVVFFHLFHRGNSGYDDFYYKVMQQGDMLYTQQKLDAQVHAYVQNCLNQANTQQVNQALPIDESTALAYFLQARVNVFHFERCPSDYYHESAFWRYLISPHAEEKEVTEVFGHLQAGLESEQAQSFNVHGRSLTFTPNPTPMLGSPHATPSPFDRKLPLEALIDDSLWLGACRQGLPFYLNELGEQVCGVMFGEGHPYPLVVNAPALHGKTTLLQMLSAHFLQQNDPDATGLPCLLMNANSHLTVASSFVIDGYHQFICKNKQLPYPNIDTYAWHLPWLMYHSLRDDKNFLFDEKWYIDERRFVELWQACHLSKQEDFKDLEVSLIWHILQHHIKGGFEFDGVCVYPDQHLFMLIYQKVWQEWYKPLCENEYWDLHDIMVYFNQNSNPLLTYKAILIDDCHIYSKMAIYTILRHSAYWQNPKLFFQSPIIFMGNDECGEHWQDTVNAVLTYYQKEHDYQEVVKTQTINYPKAFTMNLSPIFSDGQVYHQEQKDDLMVVNQQVHFVHVDDKEAVRALLSNLDITLYANYEGSDDGIYDYFKNHEGIGDIFSLSSDPIRYLPTYNASHLGNKTYQIALFGFDDEQFFDLVFADKNTLSKQDNLKRQFLLSRLGKIFNTVLKDIFIIVDDKTQALWQKLFASVLPNISTVTHDFIYPSYEQRLIKLNHEKTQEVERAKLNKNTEKLSNITHYYLRYFYYEEYFKLLFQICDIHKDYEPLFNEVKTENQKEWVFTRLWSARRHDLWIRYASYCPKSLMGNLSAICLLEGESINFPTEKLYQLALQTYHEQYENELFIEYWRVIVNPLFRQLKQTTLNNVHLVDVQLNRLCEHHQYIPFLHVAEFYLHHHDEKNALRYWQLAEHAGLDLPSAYYEIMLKNNQDWRDDLIPLLCLNELGEFMYTLDNHDINELHDEYWQKILPYLAEYEEIEGVLLYFLPKIQSVEILKKILAHCEHDVSSRFASRLQRLITLRACLTGDWETVISRLEHYLPANEEDILNKLSFNFSQVQVKQHKAMKQATFVGPQFRKPQEEVVDMLYALNLNPEFTLLNDKDEFDEYCKKPHIHTIFKYLRQIFSVKNPHNDKETTWNTSFPAVRALAFLMEKSNVPIDATGIYLGVAQYANKKDTLKGFAIERCYRLLKRAERFTAIEKEKILAEVETQEELDEIQGIFEQVNESQKSLLSGFPKELEKLLGQDDLPLLDPIKTDEEILNGILAINDKEQRELKELKKEKQLAEKRHKEAQEKAEKERLAKEKAEQERLEQERLAQERVEQERLEQERLEQERLEQERLEQERLEQEKIEQERLEQERLAQEQLEREQAEQARLEQERLAQEQLEGECLTQEQAEQACLAQEQKQVYLEDEAVVAISQTPPSSPAPMPDCEALPVRRAAQKAISELQFFEWRVSVYRLAQRINIENSTTGERCSYLADGTLHSDWQYHVDGVRHHFVRVPLILEKVGERVRLYHTEHDVELMVGW